MPLSFKHIFAIIPYTMPLFGKRPYIHGMVPVSVYRRAFPAVMLFPGDYFLLTKVCDYYSFTLKTASVLHGNRKRVRDLMVSDNQWLTLHIIACILTIDVQ